MMNKLKERIKSLFPEIEEIKDNELKEKVIECWKIAIEESCFTPDELEKIPFTLLIKPAPFSLIEHTKAVTKTALKIAEVLEEMYKDKVKINRDYLIAGALLHDVGKLLEYEKNEHSYKKSKNGEMIRHPISGAGIAYKVGLPAQVIHIISSHSKEGEFVKRTIEAIIVHHADFVNFEPFRG